MPPQEKASTPSAADLTKVFQGLSIEPSAEPLPEPMRANAGAPNPFTEPLRASVEKSTPYSMYIPPEAVQRAVFLINSAARKAEHGVRVVVDVQRDKQGKIVKDASGKSVPVVQADGPNKGKVLVRFQGKAERKQQKAPRPYSIVRDKADKTVYYVRDRATKQNIYKGTHEEAKAEYDRLKAEYASRVVQAPAQPATPAATQPAAPGSAIDAAAQADQPVAPASA